ncbi:hypothetical protein KW459_15935 [Vibrio fluvialis]|nr:hypothetical protein [Vibrio fluvialis]
MPTKRYIVPETSVTITTDLVWGLGSNVSSNAAYQNVFGATFAKYSSKGVQSLLGNNIVQIGVVDSSSDIKEGANYSAALTVSEFLRDQKVHEEKAPTLYLIKLNEEMYYALGLRGPRIIVDKTIPFNGEKAEQMAALASLQNEYDDHNFLYSGSNWNLVVLSKIHSVGDDEQPLDGEENRDRTNDFISSVMKIIQSEDWIESDREYTLTTIFKAVDKKNLHAIRNISQLKKRSGGKPIVGVLVIISILTGGFWYKSHLEEQERTRLVLLEQQSRERIAAMKQARAVEEAQKPTSQMTDVVQLQKSALLQEKQWIATFETTDVPSILAAMKRQILQSPVEVNGWDLERVTQQVRMDLDHNSLAIDTKNFFNNLRDNTTLSEIVKKFGNIESDLTGTQVVVNRTEKPATNSIAKKIQSRKVTEIELISALQDLKNRAIIESWNLREEENKRPLPLPETLVDMLTRNTSAVGTEVSKDSWLHPLVKYRLTVSGKFTSTIDEVEKVIRSVQAPLLITGAQYNVVNQYIQLEFVTYAHKQ